MRNTFNVLFYIKKNAPLRNGNAPIMGRITINGERTQFSTRLSVAPEHWDVGMGRVAGRSNAAGRINEQLSNIHYHIERCYNKLFYEQSFVTLLRKILFEITHGDDSFHSLPYIYGQVSALILGFS